MYMPGSEISRLFPAGSRCTCSVALPSQANLAVTHTLILSSNSRGEWSSIVVRKHLVKMYSMTVWPQRRWRKARNCFLLKKSVILPGLGMRGCSICWIKRLPGRPRMLCYTGCPKGEPHLMANVQSLILVNDIRQVSELSTGGSRITLQASLC